MRPITISRLAIALFFLGMFTSLKAQVCNGSLGDPVVNVNFGSGTSTGNPLLSASTTYSFTSSFCPDDGSYTVVSSSAGCFGGTWHSLIEDHTPNDVNGYMMLVNASFTPGDFYVDTVKDLCANTTYEFAAWITNVLLPTSCSPNPIFPKLIFNIETTAGIVLGSYSSGDIPSATTPTWKQYGLFFTTPPNTNNVVIRITNTAPGGCGNDLALDDITFRPCGPSVALTGTNNQTIFDLCDGDVSAISLTANIGSGYASPSLQWQESIDNGTTWKDLAGVTSIDYVFTKTAVGSYQYRSAVADGSNITVSSCRVVSNVINITIHDKPVASASGNGAVCENSIINLTAGGGATYTWSGPGNFTSTLNSPSLLASVNSAGQYKVVVTDQFGCSNNAATNISILAQPIATISNDVSICEGESADLNVGGGSSYLWSPATGLSGTTSAAVIARPAATTTYSAVVTGINSCTDTATVVVTILNKAVANAGANKVILKGESIVLDGAVAGTDISYFWTPPAFLDNAVVLNPKTTPATDQLYTLHAVSNVGCGAATDDVSVKVFNGIYIPKAFSPNNDGLNDTWRIEALTVFPDSKLLVYNRYGQVVFESTAANKNWDGWFKSNEMPAGAYAYLIDLKNNRPLLKGMVVIVK